MSNDGPIKIGVVGVGYLGRHHALKYTDIQDVELVGVVDIDKERAEDVARECSTRAYTDYHQLFGKVDGVSIVTPTRLHFQIAREFLERGVDVLLEKPITQSVEEATALIKIADQKGAILQGGHIERFNPAVIALHNAVNKPMFIESHRLSHFKERGTDVDVILDLMIHDIDIILSLVSSSVISIDAVGVPVISGNVDIANARISFESGCVANVTASRISSKITRKIRVFQHNAYVSVDYNKPSISVYEMIEKGRSVPQIVSRDVEMERTDALYEEITSFIRCIRTREMPVVTGRDGKRALEVALEIQEKVSMWQRDAEGF